MNKDFLYKKKTLYIEAFILGFIFGKFVNLTFTQTFIIILVVIGIISLLKKIEPNKIIHKILNPIWKDEEKKK